MPTDRKLLVGAVSLVRGKVRGDIQEGSLARDEVEALMGEEYFEGGPFRRVGVIIRYGEQTNLEPEYQRIRAIDGELPIAYELDMEILKPARGEDLRAIFRQSLIEVLIAVAKKYDRPHDRLLAAEPRQMVRDRLEAGLGHHVPDEEDVHRPAVQARIPGGGKALRRGGTNRRGAGPRAEFPTAMPFSRSVLKPGMLQVGAGPGWFTTPSPGEGSR